MRLNIGLSNFHPPAPYSGVWSCGPSRILWSCLLALTHSRRTHDALTLTLHLVRTFSFPHSIAVLLSLYLISQRVIMAAKSVAEFLQTHKADFKLTPTNKVRSRITGHEMSVSLDVILAYFHSKKYQKAVEWHAFDVDKYDYIIPHKSDKNKMWCQLTNQPLNKIPEQIVKHVQGKKFVRYPSTVIFCPLAVLTPN